MLPYYKIALAILLASCGTGRVKLSGDTTHTAAGGTTSTVSGEVVTRFVISVDFAACEAFSQLPDKEDCMRKMLDLFVAMQELITKTGKLPTLEVPK